MNKILRLINDAEASLAISISLNIILCIMLFGLLIGGIVNKFFS